MAMQYAFWNSACDGLVLAVASKLSPASSADIEKSKKVCVFCERGGEVLPLRWRREFSHVFDPAGNTPLCAACFEKNAGARLARFPGPFTPVISHGFHVSRRDRFEGIGVMDGDVLLALHEDMPFVSLLSTDAGFWSFNVERRGKFSVELVKRT